MVERKKRDWKAEYEDIMGTVDESLTEQSKAPYLDETQVFAPWERNQFHVNLSNSTRIRALKS